MRCCSAWPLPVPLSHHSLLRPADGLMPRMDQAFSSLGHRAHSPFLLEFSLSLLAESFPYLGLSLDGIPSRRPARASFQPASPGQAHLWVMPGTLYFPSSGSYIVFAFHCLCLHVPGPPGLWFMVSGTRPGPRPHAAASAPVVFWPHL